MQNRYTTWNELILLVCSQRDSCG